MGIAAMVVALAFAGAVFAYASFDRLEPAAVKTATQKPSEPLSRSDPGVEPWKEAVVEPRLAEEPVEPEPRPEPEPAPEPEPEPVPDPEPVTRPEPPPRIPDAEPQPEPEPAPVPPPPSEEPPPPEERPAPEEPPADVEEPEPYALPDGAVMALTVETLGLREIPVFDSTGGWALKYGVGHDPDTSLPWTDSPHRNVYVAGHKIGFPGTASDRVFDRLGDLGEGDEVVLRGKGGEKYRYRVTESFVASPEDSWVRSRVRGEDLLTLQTCVGPNFSERLIVRAERV